MYADKTSASCTVAGTCLAVTGMDVTQAIFWIVSAAVLLIAGFTLLRMFQAKPSMIESGPAPVKERRWSIRKR